MKMIDHNHFICHLILGTFTEYPKDKLFKRGIFVCNPLNGYLILRLLHPVSASGA